MTSPLRGPTGGAAFAIGLATVAAVLSAQEPAFRSATRLVRLDVSVLDATKAPVHDLTVTDFQVTERGKPLRIRTFETVAMPTNAEMSTVATASLEELMARDAAPPAREATADVTAVNPGRLIVLVMDDDMLPNDPRWTTQAKAIAGSVVEQMGPNDRVAIQRTRVSNTRLELSTDKVELQAQIDRFSAGGFLALPPTDTGADEVPRYRRSLAAFEFTVEALATLTDRRKMIVYVGPGVPVQQESGRPSVLGGLDPEFLQRMASLFRDAERANVVVYTFDPTGMDGLEDYAYDKYFLAARTKPTLCCSRPSIGDVVEGARQRARQVAQWTVAYSSAVAENTGGRALVRTDNFEPAVQQMFADTSFYYLVAVEPLSATPDGRFHEVTITVNRKDVDVRARRGYYYTP